MPMFQYLKQAFIVLTFLLLASAASAQGKFGNEWIKYDQTYHKLKVVNTGLHRLDYAELQSLGLADVNPKQLQLFRRGKEVAIHVAGEEDGKLDAQDFLEFFGERNDGALDAELYKNPAHQMHQFYSLYTDTAAYFLTVAPTNGKRMVQQNPAVNGKTPEPYFMRKAVSVLVERYHLGKAYIAPANSNNPALESRMSWMDEGEGYASHPSINPKNYNIGGVSNVVTTGPKPVVRYATVGTFKEYHKLDVNIIAASGAARKLGYYEYDFFGSALDKKTIEFTDVQANGNVTIQIVPTPSSTRGNAVGLLFGEVTFPQLTNFIGSQFIFYTDSTRSQAPYYELKNAPATAVAYDITDPFNPIRIMGNAATGGRGFVITQNATTRKVLVANSVLPLKPAKMASNITFRQIDPAAHNYIIVTNKLLLKKVDGSDLTAPEEYAAYRASTAGGAYKTLLLEMGQIVDQFHYGEFSSNSIRRLMQFMGQSPELKHLFLLGKGIKYAGDDMPALIGTGRNSYYHIGLRNPKVHEIDLVPTGISPSSDIFFTADFRNNSYVPRAATGRLSASSAESIMHYLSKVKEYEETPDGQAWQKNILQLGGGVTALQIWEISQQLVQLREIAEDPYLGANVIERYRQNVSQTVEEINVSKEVNNGLSLMTFFGHSSRNTNDLDIGLVSNPIYGYNNKGKYPAILMLGCNAGDAFVPGNASFGEDWVLTPDKGAIAFIAHLDMGGDSHMYNYYHMFYMNAFRNPEYYGKSIGQIQQAAINGSYNSFKGSPNHVNNVIAMVTQMALQGDPAVRLYSPSKPDYLIPANGVALESDDNSAITADSKNVKLAVKVGNLGKALESPITVSVKRTLADNTAMAYEQFEIDPVYREDTVYLTLDNSTINALGLNTFEIKLDGPDEFDELNETNNTAVFQYFFPVNGVFALTPTEYSIVNTKEVNLKVQATKLEETRGGYVIEVDTTDTFKSPIRKSFTSENALIGSQKIDLASMGNLADSTVVFWRARFNNYATNEDTLWTVSSFRYINGSQNGWSQSHKGQFTKMTTNRVILEDSRPLFNFLLQKTEVILRTIGGDLRYTNPPHGIFVDGRQLFSASCSDPGRDATPRIFMVVVDNKSLKMVERLGSGFACASSPHLYEFGDLNNATNRAKIETFLKLIPNGFHVVALSVNKVPFESFTQSQKDAFKTIGSGLIDGLKNGYPFAIIGRKGGAPGSARETTADLSNEAIVPTSQSVAMRVELESKQQSGEITSTKIGPALNWTNLTHMIKKSGSGDTYRLNVLGFKMDANQPDTLFRNVTAKTLDLSGIDAKEYPYLQLHAKLSDPLDRTAPQLEQWLVTYTEAPEGVIRPDLVTINRKMLTDQANTGSIKVPMAFQNISTTAFPEKIKVEFRLTGEGLAQPIIETLEFNSLPPNAIANLDYVTSTRPLSGNYLLRIFVNPRVQAEQHYFNNIFEIPFEVDRKLHPVMDVAFDGVHIMDGELVSPSPLISIVVKDQNKHNPIQDPKDMMVKLIDPNGVETEVDLMGNAAEVKYFPADEKSDFKVEYKPTQLQDGVYSMEVNAKDNTSKAAGISPYRISFEVENESTITNFFPYPNPFSTKTQFIFTLTGAAVPENMKIQIMTVTGKVVKEILKEEMGPIRIGNNKTAYAWDGTDSFGDKLANGVYLYRVVMSQDASEMKHKYKTADKAFTNGYGKLYILR